MTMVVLKEDFFENIIKQIKSVKEDINEAKQKIILMENKIVNDKARNNIHKVHYYIK